jgi:GNAT superfamily N-acetyltransferase
MSELPAESQVQMGEDLITIRPIRFSDTAMEAAFIRGLSPETKHYRFLGGVSELSPRELKRMCDIDGEHSMAFVATTPRNGVETEIGVSRYVPNSKADTREIAVTVADEWRLKGLGTMLMQRLIQSARSHGVKHLYSIELADNTAMQVLAQELGMTASRDPEDTHQVIYTLAL